jgi:predicted Zn finger-like uncharacterized protein
MNTRCPKCRTTFAVSDSQLQARGGVVRCGHCGQVFRADHHRIRTHPPTPRPPSGRKRGRKPQAAVAAAGAGSRAPTTERRLPTIEELLTGRTRTRTPLAVWVAGNAVMILVLLAQILHFYGNNLVSWQPAIRPYLEPACEILRCNLHPRVDVGLIEITASSVAPHPKYSNALLLRTTMINRANFAQPYPLMEVTISNHRGKTIGRRVFGPEAYLAGESELPTTMIPNLIVRAKLEFTRPGARADGYEIRLLADKRKKNKTTDGR